MWALLIILLVSCNLPKDPSKTLVKLQKSHVLKVGTCTTITPLEKNLVTMLATQLNAKIIWSFNNQEALYRHLKNNTVDLVACGIRDDSPWSSQIAFTIPFTRMNQHGYVFAVPQGENAWLSYVNAFIYSHRSNK